MFEVQMIRNFLLFPILIFAAILQINAQGKPKLEDCRKVFVEDSAKRDFNDRDSFAIDVDGDGTPDTFTTRTYAVKFKRRISGKAKPQTGEIHWIAFDLKTSRGRILKSFFKYRYGTDEADYYIYAFVPCQINNDGKTDLLFYSGDEQSDETIILENKGNSFKIRSRKRE